MMLSNLLNTERFVSCHFNSVTSYCKFVTTLAFIVPLIVMNLLFVDQ